MNETNFAAAINTVADASPETVFESAMTLVNTIQHMEEDEVTAFWRTSEIFIDLCDDDKPLKVARRLQYTAWARMTEIVDECYLKQMRHPDTPSPFKAIQILQTRRVAA